MARIRLRALRRALTSYINQTDTVHFHNGPQGQPAVCFDHGCRRPKLDVG
jgi:hypothetical protein